MAKFKVGDKVNVINKGKLYSTYSDFIHEVLLEKSHLWKFGREIDNGLVCTVLASHAHLTIPGYGMLYIVENPEKSEVYIMGEAGLELIEPNFPRICYLLGGEDTPLEVGEKFEINTADCKGVEYRINESGCLEFANKNIWCECSTQMPLVYVIDNPEKIIRKPKLTFTDDEKAMLRLYAGAGYLWVARNKETSCIAFATGKPTKDGSCFIATLGSLCCVLKTLLPQITFESSPIYIPDYVGVQDNG